jgi:hypothetical protein
MVSVAQLVELSVVVRAVAGSSPVAHPIFPHKNGKFNSLFLKEGWGDLHSIQHPNLRWWGTKLLKLAS